MISLSLRARTAAAVSIGIAAIVCLSCRPETSPYRACPPTPLPLPADGHGPKVDEHHLRAWVDLLADPARRGRRASTPEAHEVAGLLGLALDRTELESAAAGRCQEYPFVEGKDFNIIGHLVGPEGSPWVMVTAHYDARGVHPNGKVLLGADDNASGVAALLEVARLASQESHLPVSVVFALLGAEEIGFVGIKTWLANPSLPDEPIDFAINLDMVGRALPDGAIGIGYSLPAPGYRELLAMLQQATDRSGVPLVSLDRWHAPEELFSDSTVLAEHFPAVLLSTGLHADYHQAGDSADKVDTAQIRSAAELTLEILRSPGDINGR